MTDTERLKALTQVIVRATPTTIDRDNPVPDELPEYFLAVVNDVDSQGPAAFGAADWLAKFDAIILLECPVTTSPVEVGEALTVFNRLVVISTLHTFKFWFALIENLGLQHKLRAMCPAETMEAKTLN